ncbi:MAG: hypothetical protein RL508_35 [Actinomycetota bacterium]|jgi:hypothetical protein
MKRLIAITLVAGLSAIGGVAALAVPAQAATKVVCPKTEPKTPLKVTKDVGYPAPHVVSAAVFCVYDNVTSAGKLMGSAKVKNYMAMAQGVNASRKVPAVQNYACTLDLGPSTAVIFLDTAGHLDTVVHEEYGCHWLYSSQTKTKYWLDANTQALFQKYMRYATRPVKILD